MSRSGEARGVGTRAPALWLAGTLALCLAGGAPAVVGAQAAARQPTTVFVVRHGEKDTIPHENPPLSAAGLARATALAEALRDAGITAIVTTQQRRTQQTAQPLAAARRLAPVSVPMDGAKPEEHVRAVVEAVRRLTANGGVVLVVDHQSTIPAVIAALGAPRPPTMCDVEFSNLYVLLPGDGGAVRLARAHYGAPDPPHDAGCTITPRSPP